MLISGLCPPTGVRAPRRRPAGRCGRAPERAPTRHSRHSRHCGISEYDAHRDRNACAVPLGNPRRCPHQPCPRRPAGVQWTPTAGHRLAQPRTCTHVRRDAGYCASVRQLRGTARRSRHRRRLHPAAALDARRVGGEGGPGRKHVLVEKPISLDGAGVRTLQSAARTHDVIITEAFMYRHHPLVAKARELAHDGTIGRLQGVRGTFSFVLDRRVRHAARSRIRRWQPVGRRLLSGLVCPHHRRPPAALRAGGGQLGARARSTSVSSDSCSSPTTSWRRCTAVSSHPSRPRWRSSAAKDGW